MDRKYSLSELASAVPDFLTDLDDAIPEEHQQDRGYWRLCPRLARYAGTLVDTAQTAVTATPPSGFNWASLLPKLGQINVPQPTLRVALSSAFTSCSPKKKDVDNEYVYWALEKSGGNLAEARRITGMSENTLRKHKRGIDQ